MNGARHRPLCVCDLVEEDQQARARGGAVLADDEAGDRARLSWDVRLFERPRDIDVRSADTATLTA